MTSTEVQRTSLQAGPFPGVGVGVGVAEGDVSGVAPGLPAVDPALLPAVDPAEVPADAEEARELLSGPAPAPQETTEAARKTAADPASSRPRSVG